MTKYTSSYESKFNNPTYYIKRAKDQLGEAWPWYCLLISTEERDKQELAHVLYRMEQEVIDLKAQVALLIKLDT